MATNLLEVVQRGMPAQFADRAAGLLGESGATTGSALGSLLPLLLAALAHKGASPSGAQSVMSMLDNPAVNTSLTSGTDALFGDGGAQASSLMASGAPIASSLLGDKVEAVAGTLSSLSGMRTTQSVTNLIALLAPIVLAFVKRQVATDNLSASGLAAFLGAQAPTLQAALDGRLTSALGFASPASMISTAGDPARATSPSVAPGYGTGATAMEPTSWIGRWWPWIVAAIVVLFLLSRCMGGDVPTGQSTAPVPAAPTTAQALPSDAAPTPPAAPVAGPAAGSVAAPTALPAKVYFDAGKSTLSDAGKATVAAIAGLISTDGGKVDITGYADSTGDPAQNAEIAKNRAMAVRDALQADGVAATSITLKPPASFTGTGGDAEARRVEVTKTQ
ncbi:MAG: DUF937 domain-containing protein [Betaproteobacteria bacterium]